MLKITTGEGECEKQRLPRLYDQLVLVSNLSSFLLVPVCGMSQVYTLFSTSQDAREMDLTVGRALLAWTLA